MTKMRSMGLALTLLSMASACEEERPAETTAVVLTLDTDFGPALQGAWVRVYAADADLTRASDRPVAERQLLNAAALSAPVVIKKQNAEAFLLLVRGFGAGGPSDTVVEYAVRGHFVEGATMAMPVFLASRCMAMACDTAHGTTCYGESHGEVCEGQCGPIYDHDTMFAIEHEGDEQSSGWRARSCLDAGFDPPTPPTSDGGGDADAHASMPDGGTPDSGAQDAHLDDAGAGCETVSPEDVCSLANRCGCAVGTSCTPGEFRSDDEIMVSCEVHASVLAGSCVDDLDCPDWHVCLGVPERGTMCYSLCASHADCGLNWRCLPTYNEDAPIKGENACFQECTRDMDCPSRCCLENTCAPAGYCACTHKEFEKGCTSDRDCCSVNDQPSECRITSSDAGVDSFCVSKCSSPSQCGSGRCCVYDACWSREVVEKDAVKLGLDPATVCVP